MTLNGLKAIASNQEKQLEWLLVIGISTIIGINYESLSTLIISSQFSYSYFWGGPLLMTHDNDLQCELPQMGTDQSDYLAIDLSRAQNTYAVH